MTGSIQDIVKERILILDGAMGTMVQTYHLEENDFWNEEIRSKVSDLAISQNFDIDKMQMKGNNDVLILTRPDVILDIHRRYLAAGADIIETDTFSSQRISESDYHLEDFCYQLNFEGAKIARKAADEYSTAEKPRFVAGSIGPTNKTLSMSPNVSDPSFREISYDDLYNAYVEQVEGLIDGGVDLFLIETIFDTLNAKCAIDACVQTMKLKNRDIPIMVSLTISDLAGRSLSGQTLEAFLVSMSGYPIFSIGMNCAFGAPQMKPYLKRLGEIAPFYISAHPNAGLPNSMGLYDETPESMAPQIAEFVDEKLVNIIGGCCGTTPDFIAKYVPVVEGKKPHVPSEKSSTMWLSGLEQLDVTSEIKFVNVGERCNVAGSRKFLRLIKEKNYEEAISIARKQVADGALVIDINMDDGLLDAKTEMVHFLNMIAGEPDIAKVPFMIDSSKWNVITEALKCVQGKCIVNSISLKEGEEKFISHAQDVKRFGAAVVVMCFDEIGQATTFERRIEIAKRSYDILTQIVGMNPLDIIFDPNVLSIATGMDEHDNYAVDFIKATGWIKKNLPGAHISGGVSNLSFSFRGINYIREAMHAVFLYHAIQQGMDFGIVNPSTKVTYSDIPQEELKIIEDVVLNRKSCSQDSISPSDKLIELAEVYKAKADAAKAAKLAGNVEVKPKEEWRDKDVDSRLSYALRKGITDYLNEDIDEALKKYPHAVDIIEGPLMAGMNEVGDLFGAGKMFLPQVVKTARTMKFAVNYLQPYIESEKTSGTSSSGKILMATVKGDVHDIGKNIVAVVMACNNYDVIDMGVMVPAEQIVQKAIEENVDAIGLSGLITPSLDEMVNVAKELRNAGLDIPLLIGGATTSQLHVALKIAPVYNGPVVWVKDASQDVIVASKLLNVNEKESFVKELNDTYRELREGYAQEQQGKTNSIASLDDARSNKLELFN